MAVTATPIYPQAGLVGLVQVTTANANRDGSTGTYSSSIAAGANGSLVDYIFFQATGTTAAGCLRIFYSADNATNWRLVQEVLAIGAVPDGSTISAEIEKWFPLLGSFPLTVGSGIKFNVQNNETWNVFVIGGNF